MNPSTLIEESKNTGYYKDVLGMAKKALPERPLEESVDAVAKFIIFYSQMWHDVGNQDPYVQDALFSGFNPLFLDLEHKQINPDLNATDYLKTFKIFMQRWAARTAGTDDLDSWFRAQSEFATTIRYHVVNKDIESQPLLPLTGPTRREPRLCLQPDSFGDDLESCKVDSFGSELADMLTSQGYQERVYRMDQDMVTIAYFLKEVPFRKEPILLDYGGTILPQSKNQVIDFISKIGKPHMDVEPMEGDYVLKVAVRDAYGKNEGLHSMVISLLAKYGIVSPNKGWSYRTPLQDTVVYALKGYKEPLSENHETSQLIPILQTSR